MSSLRLRSLAIALPLAAAAASPARACHVVADAGGPDVLECNGSPATLTLDGTRSAQCPGVTPRYLWTTTCPGGRFDDPSSLTPTLSLDATAGCPVECEVTLLAEDDFGGRDRDTAPVRVEDTRPPVAGPHDAVLALLWPPDHSWRCYDLAELAAAGAVLDECDPAPAWRLIGCRSSEPVDGRGDGATADDCAIATDGGSVCARAERSGSGAGRSYFLDVEAVDRCGNASGPLAAGRLFVPHDRR